jgi:hypothetical protein
VLTDAWQGYAAIDRAGYTHKAVSIRASSRSASELMPRVHRVASLLKRWLLATHQGSRAARAARLLPRRVHLPVQPARLPSAGPAVLPTPAPSRTHSTATLRHHRCQLADGPGRPES